MSTLTSLKIGQISYVPFDSYPKDFTFIVNQKEYHTNKLMADLLSKKISNIHLTDPTIDHYEILTEYSGDFQQILDILKADNLEINSSELPFFTEITNALDIDINIKSQPNHQLTLDNVLDLIYSHEKYENFYSNFLSEEIEFVSKNFYKLKETQENSLLSLSSVTIQSILSSENLCLESEDQLLDFVNKLYVTDRTLAGFYDFVNFSNVSCDAINHFSSIFNIDDITRGTWDCIVTSLLNKSSVKLNNGTRYKKDRNCLSTKSQNTLIFSNKQNREETGAADNNQHRMYVGEIGPFIGNNSNGIFSHLRQINRINSSVKVSASSDGCGFDIKKILQNNNPDFTFYTRNIPNSWICFKFINYMISVTHYTIRTDKWNKVNGNHPRSWVIEGSNGDEWDVIDERMNDSALNGAGFVSTFQAWRNTHKMYNSIRIKLTDTNWNNNDYLMLNSIEFYGNIES